MASVLEKDRASLDADVSKLTDDVMLAIRPLVEERIRLHVGTMAQRQVRALLMPVLSGTMEDRHVQASPAQDARRAAFGVPGTSLAGIVELMTARGTGGATGTEVLDFLQKQKGVEKRDTARKAITRAREMGIIKKNSEGRWVATGKRPGD